MMACFSDRVNPPQVIARLIAEWADRLAVPKPPQQWTSTVHLEHWTHVEVGEHLDRLAILQPRIITTERPRRYTGPLVVIDFGGGRIGQIDGRRRANYWRNIVGSYPVLVICVS